MKKVFAVFVWFLCLMAVWNLAAHMISASNTFIVILGLVLAFVFGGISYVTLFFTRMPMIIWWGKKK